MNLAQAFLASAAGLALAGSLANASSAASKGADVTNIAGFDRIRIKDKINYNLNSGDFTIPGSFSATRAGTDITADSAQGNSKTKLLHARGHVVVRQSQPLANRGKATDLTQRPSTLTTDQLDVDGQTKRYTATGHMHFTQEGGRDATSDSAVLDEATHKLHMEGHVHVKDGEQTIESDTLDYNTATGQLDGNGNVTITSPVESPGPRDRIAPPKRKKLPF